MTSQPEPAAEPKHRKFDDVTSLFGSIVPAPGSPVRAPRAFRPLPTALPMPEDAYPPVVPPPPQVPEPVDDAPMATQAVLVAPAAAPPPPPPARPRPAEIPWPDAFEPLPNYRKKQPRNWSWLLLIPVGILVAVGIGTLNPSAVRGWVEVNVLRRDPALVGANTSLLPGPFRSDYVPPAPVPGISPGADPSNPTPALPTTPPDAADATAPAPAPAPSTSPAAAPAVAAPASIHVTIQYRRGVPGAEGEARRLAALLQSTGGSVELHPTGSTTKVPTITYGNAADKDAAGALALALANEAVNWTVKPGNGSSQPGSIEIWMP